LLLVAGFVSARSAAVADFLAGKVVFEKEIAPGAGREVSGDATMIYVLGGNQDSLSSRFETASRLYHRGVAGKIHILSRPGITEFSPELRRNLTNDEWSAGELEKRNVEREDVVPVPVTPSFFGTLNEARRVSGMIREQKCRRLVLVTSSCHTRRSFDAFSGFLAGIPVEICVYGAGHRGGFMNLVVENVKRIVYNYVLIPIYVRAER